MHEWSGILSAAQTASIGANTALGQLGELFAYHPWRLPYALFAFGLGALTAGSEIIVKYIDAPLRAVFNRAGILYWVLNGVISALVYMVGMRPEINEANVVVVPDALANLSQAAAAGIGAQLLLRSKVQFGSGQNAFGPGQLLDRWFGYLDRVIDRKRARARLEIVTELMAGKEFSEISLPLANDLAHAMQSLTDEEAETIGAKVSDINNSVLDDADRARSLGFVVLDFGGEEFLREWFKDRA